MTDFDFLCRHLDKLSTLSLPGRESHQKMWSVERKNLIENIDFSKVNPRESAIMAILFPKANDTHILFIERAIYDGVHSGQIAFPGGKREVDDKDLYQTALRETHEEVGVYPSRLQKIKELTPVYVPPSNFLITPFLAIHPQPIEMQIDGVEVDASLSVSVADLMNVDNIKQVNMNTSYGVDINVPAYVIDGKIVWGATAMIVAEIVDILQKI